MLFMIHSCSMLMTHFREMGDVDGPLVANTVYQEFFKNKSLDLAVIPYALDDAAQLLRRQGVPAVRWATFIHIGT
jgi:hypothetical protein